MILLVTTIEELDGAMCCRATGHTIEGVPATERERKEMGEIAQLIVRRAEAKLKASGAGQMFVNDPKNLINPP